MGTAGRFTEIRHTSKDPLPCAAERQMAKGKRRTTAKGVTWCVSAKESIVIDLVGPVSWVNSVNQEVHCADKGKTDNAGQPPWHPVETENRRHLGFRGSDTPPLLRCTSSSIPETRSYKSIIESANCTGPCAMLFDTEVGILNHFARSP